MRNIYNKLFLSVLFVCIGLFSAKQSVADGSKDMYPAGVPGKRAFLYSNTGSGSEDSWPFKTLGAHYVYADAGEVIAIASSAHGLGTGLQGQFIVTDPAGNSTVISYDGSTGRIPNRLAELAGPASYGGAAVGDQYTPQYYTATVAGVYRIELTPTTNATTTEVAVANVNANDSWSQATNSPNIAAWDISVWNTSAASYVPGRVYTTVMNLNIGQDWLATGGFYAKMYPLTRDGWVYQVDNNGSVGAYFTFFVNNKGFSDPATQIPSYKSLNSSDAGIVRARTKDPRTVDDATNVTHKMFYTMPAADLPTSASIFLDGATTATWLKNAALTPTITNLSVTGAEGVPNQLSNKGGYINFESNIIGTVEITIADPNGTAYPAKVITTNAVVGPNEIYWDGTDGNGNKLPAGNVPAQINLRLFGAEVHFPYIDMEINPNGTIIQLLDESGNPIWPGGDIVYWDDTDVTGGNTNTRPNPMYNGRDGSGLHSNPANSAFGMSDNGHRWGRHANSSGSGTSNSGDGLYSFGNLKSLDTWSYIIGTGQTEELEIKLLVADLEVVSVTTTANPKINIGDDISYQVTVRNNNDPSINSESDVTGAPFKFQVPEGFIINDISDIVINTSCGTVNGAAIDADGNYTALLDLPTGCTVDFTITGTVGAALSGNTLNVEATILRPNDVTDPDATNPDPGTPPTDPHYECDNNGQGGNCNNILGNAAVAVNIPPVAVDDAETTNQGETVDVSVLTNDTDGDGNATIDVTAVQLVDPVDGNSRVTEVTVAGEGTYTVNSTTGAIEFVPLPGFAGIATPVQYTIKDELGAESEPAALTITVIPIGANDTDETAIGQSVSTNVRTNDGPDDGAGNPIGSTIDFGTISDPANGTAIEDPDNPGQILYTPDADFIGADTYTYTLITADGVESAPITVTIAVKPVGVDDEDTVDANSTVTTTVKANDGPSGVDTEVNIVTVPTNGVTVVNPDGTVTYTPNEDFYGVDTYTYTLTTDDGVVSDPITVTITVVANPELTVTKVVTSAGPYDGTDDVITYGITVANTGNVTIDNIVLTDANAVIPAGQENIGTLAPGASTTITVTHAVTQADLDAGSVSNQATATGEDPAGDPVTDDSDDPGTPDPNDPTSTDVVQTPELTVTKVVTSAGPYNTVDDVITYDITVANTGNVTIDNIVLTDANAVIPAGQENIGTLAPGTSTTITVTHAVTQADLDAGSVSNQATVTGEDPVGDPVTDDSDNPDTTDPDDPTDTDVVQTPELTVTKVITSAGPYDSTDDVITYDITVANTGNVTIDNIVLTDANAVIPAGQENIGTLAPGASTTIT
ncbi:Ig-like domain-containing protein, partial [Parapedobacter sp. GCM10030251]|uniref:DUF7507 domain-containing protein n=1 Tax=Parapedobacter sp. GCM10030251 TaxID=3273419 RepID=UPI0036214F76